MYSVEKFDFGHLCQWAAFHADLALPERCVVCRKGFRRDIDSYSAFFENDRTTATGLEDYLKGLGVKRVFVVGVAYDFCVRYTAEVRPLSFNPEMNQPRGRRTT